MHKRVVAKRPARSQQSSGSEAAKRPSKKRIIQPASAKAASQAASDKGEWTEMKSGSMFKSRRGAQP